MCASDYRGSRRVELLGCAPQGNLRHGIEHPGTRRATIGNAHLDFLDPAGQCIGSYFVNGITVEQAAPSPTEPELFDVTVSLICDELRPEAEWPWQLFRSGHPVPHGMWRPLCPAARRAWLSVALHRHPYLPGLEDPPGARYELAGRYVVDEDSFYCAIGEAVNGPGGYFGWNLDALDDCMRGGYGATPPFTIVWTEHRRARTHLEVSALPGSAPYFEVIRDICAQRQVDLVLC